MSHRQDFFNVLSGSDSKKIPFFPDITDWFNGQKEEEGKPRRFGPAQFIFDDDPYHKEHGKMPEKFKYLSLMGFYKEFDWGFPVHISDWCKTTYSNGVEKVTKIVDNKKVHTFHTPKGDLERIELLSPDGTWGVHDYFVKDIKDLDIMELVVESTHFTETFENVKKIMDAMGEQGEGDIVISRSPFGKLVHEYMGFEKVIYAMFDSQDRILDFLKIQEAKDLEKVELAAKAPEKLVILSDHADENLISPNQLKDYCIPFYQKAVKILHDAGKYVSTHLDGNFKGYFPQLANTHFDLLDGCTPAPMFNYEVEELGEAIPDGQKAFCGVPSTLFCQNLPIQKIYDMADRIMDSLGGKLILNVGDILPPDGDIEQVIALGEYVKKRNNSI